MPRRFATSSSWINVGIGGLSGFTSGSYVALCRKTTTNGSGIVATLKTSGGTFRSYVNVPDDNGLDAQFGGSSSTSSVTLKVADGWVLLAATKPSGNAPVTFHKYVYATGVWTSATGASAADCAAPAAGGRVELASFSGGSNFPGDIAALAMFANRALTAADLARMPFSLVAWLNLGPSAMWVLDQQRVSQQVVDWTGQGANQIGISGTSITTSGPPFVVYGTPLIVPTRTGSGTGPVVHDATVALSAVGGLSASAARSQVSSATLAAAGDLAGSGVLVQSATALLAGAGALTSAGTHSTSGTTALAGAGGLTAVGEIPGQSQHLFTNQTPTITDASDGAPGITVGTTIRSAVDGYAQGVRWHTTATVGGTYIGALYRVDDADVPTPAGTLLASKTLVGAPVSGGWQSITFDSPVPITAGVLYRAAVYSSDGRYVYAANMHGSDIVNGDLTADANGDDPAGLGTLRQATFTIGPTLAYPATGAGSSGSYFADIDFVGGLAPVDAAVTFPASGGITATASRTASGTVTLAATAGLAASGERAQSSGAALAAVGGLTGAVSAARATTAVLAASGGLTAVAVPTRAGTAAFAASGTLTVSAAATRQADTVLAATGQLTATGDVVTPGITTVALNAVGGLTATAAQTTTGTASLAAVGGLAASGVREAPATVVLAAQGAITATAAVERATSVTLAGTAALTSAAQAVREQAGTLTAVGGLTATAQIEHGATVTLPASGTLNGASGTTQTATAVLAAVGGLTASVTYRRRPGQFVTGSRRSRLTPGGHR